jgi:hypothetical protein
VGVERIGILENSASCLKVPPPSEKAVDIRFQIEVPSELEFYFERHFVGLVLKDEKNRRVITEKTYTSPKYTFDLTSSKESVFLNVFLNTDTPYYVKPLFKNNENENIRIDAEVVVIYSYKPYCLLNKL